MESSLVNDYTSCRRAFRVKLPTVADRVMVNKQIVSRQLADYKQVCKTSGDMLYVILSNTKEVNKSNCHLTTRGVRSGPYQF